MRTIESGVNIGDILFPGIPSNSVTLIGGKPGAGATSFALALLKAVSKGSLLLGEKPARQGPAFFLTSDKTAADTQDKVML